MAASGGRGCFLLWDCGNGRVLDGLRKGAMGWLVGPWWWCVPGLRRRGWSRRCGRAASTGGSPSSATNPTGRTGLAGALQGEAACRASARRRRDPPAPGDLPRRWQADRHPFPGYAAACVDRGGRSGVAGVRAGRTVQDDLVSAMTGSRVRLPRPAGGRSPRRAHAAPRWRTRPPCDDSLDAGERLVPVGGGVDRARGGGRRGSRPGACVTVLEGLDALLVGRAGAGARRVHRRAVPGARRRPAHRRDGFEGPEGVGRARDGRASSTARWFRPTVVVVGKGAILNAERAAGVRAGGRQRHPRRRAPAHRRPARGSDRLHGQRVQHDSRALRARRALRGQRLAPVGGSSPSVLLGREDATTWQPYFDSDPVRQCRLDSPRQQRRPRRPPAVAKGDLASGAHRVLGSRAVQ